MVSYNKINDEVLVTDEDITKVTSSDLEIVRQMALKSPLGRARLCAHMSGDDLLHEMLIALVKDNYIQPHKHPGKSESFHMIEGKLTIVIFDDHGKPVELINLSDPQNATEGEFFFYRLSKPLFHSVIPRSEVALFHETTNGPFRREDTIFANWAPSDDDEEVTKKAYMAELLQPA